MRNRGMMKEECALRIYTLPPSEDKKGSLVTHYGMRRISLLFGIDVHHGDHEEGPSSIVRSCGFLFDR